MTIIDAAPQLGGPTWNTFTPDTRLTAERYVERITVLLEGVLASNGNQRPEVLIEQLHATLSLGGELSSMPTPRAANRPAKQLLRQASDISEQLIAWADRALRGRIAEPTDLPGGPLLVRSHCYGHNLIAPAIHILLGPGGGPVPMMLYNEWIHQMVLLRDALLPFANWREVPLPVDGQGLRRLESAREAFLGELLIRQIRHTTVVDFARAVLAPGQTPAATGYGFRYAHGTVLPSVVTAPTVFTETDLLAWSPESDGNAVEFTARNQDYFEAPRTPAADAVSAADQPLRFSAVSIAEGAGDADARDAWIELNDMSGAVHRVDLGQALRGHRYAYRADMAAEHSSADTTHWLEQATVLDPTRVVAAPGMIWDREGDFRIDADADGLTVLALLGALYPENVVIRHTSDAVDPTTVGKAGPARFVLTVPDAR
ncbi:hypothetical protein [Streptomyces sp. NPDC097610]|uniref:hypothetical protein n=1 Tax=Streptomyces sp. NPDC097610 TaxID=3157227 RepID=UPI00331F555C